MSDHPDNIVLALLRAISSDVAEVEADIIKVKERLGVLGSRYANLSRRVDRIGGDVELIKRRLDLADA